MSVGYNRFGLGKFLFLFSLFILSACTGGSASLNLLVWEGYADPKFVKEFEDKHGCKVTASYMGSSDELMAKLRGGSAGNYDIISPSSDVATTLMKSKLAAPINLSKVPSYSSLSAKLKALPLVKEGEEIYGVPLVWGPNPLLFDTSIVTAPPTSWGDLWDPKYKGKIAVWDDLSTIYMTAQVLGMNKADPGAIYNLTDDQLAQVKMKLLELKPNIRKMWATGGELTHLFQSHEIVAAMGWPLMTNQLRKAKFPIGETIPTETTTGWIDHLMITEASEHKELAHAFLEYMISAQTQRLISEVTGYVPANPLAANLMTAEARTSLHMDHSEAYMAKISFWQNVVRRDKYNEVWNEIKAAQ